MAHTDGIDALVPRWDPDNPDSYTFDKSSYDREDYARFKEARAARDQARYAKSQQDFQRAMKDVAKAVREKVTETIGDNVKPGDVLDLTKPSTCFKSLTWQADEADDDSDEVTGTVVAEFYRGGDVVYEYEGITLEQAIEWSDDSLGSYFNAVIR